MFSEQEQPISELVRRVLSQVQTEFAAWNVAHCHQTLTSFAVPSTWRSCLHPDFRSPSLVLVTATSNPQPVGSEDSFLSPLVIQEVFSPDGAVVEISSMKLDVIHLSSPLEPYPPYESCSPLHRNVFKGDDSDNMVFIPYADDHTFDQASHTHHYESFSWQADFDPDLEMIVLEAVHRLQVQYALACDEIEDCNVLPLKLHSQPGRPGVLSVLRRRDHLRWTGNTIPESYTFSPMRPEDFRFRNRLETLDSFFCPNSNCIEPLCSVHVESNLMPLKSQLQISHVIGEIKIPCQNQCFINNSTEDTNPSWDETDLDIFKVISEISPQITPCDLAELCLKPCYEVFYYRKLLCLCDSNEDRSADIKTHQRTLRFNDDNPTQFTPNNPCSHTGPCGSSSRCPCFKNQSHCQRNCRCPPECSRRWQGCRCSKARTKWSCVTERCPCVEALRECDPELCLNCKCMDIADGTSCRNSQIQRGACKGLEVKRSSWGLGAFLTEAAKAGDLITEYTGELIYEPTVESRGDLAIHCDRCYVFGLNSTFSLDSTYAGNISRFINHSDAERSRRVNSQARVRLVNEDHRIGIFAVQDIEAGSEVLMDYGSEFFVKRDCEYPTYDDSHK